MSIQSAYVRLMAEAKQNRHACLSAREMVQTLKGEERQMFLDGQAASPAYADIRKKRIKLESLDRNYRRKQRWMNKAAIELIEKYDVPHVELLQACALLEWPTPIDESGLILAEASVGEA